MSKKRRVTNASVRAYLRKHRIYPRNRLDLTPGYDLSVHANAIRLAVDPGRPFYLDNTPEARAARSRKIHANLVEVLAREYKIVQEGEFILVYEKD